MSAFVLVVEDDRARDGGVHGDGDQICDDGRTKCLRNLVGGRADLAIQYPQRIVCNSL